MSSERFFDHSLPIPDVALNSRIHETNDGIILSHAQYVVLSELILPTSSQSLSKLFL
jgi:hypothetical protein